MININYENLNSLDIEQVKDNYYNKILTIKYSKKNTIQEKLKLKSKKNLNAEELFELLRKEDTYFNMIFIGYNLKKLILSKPEKIPFDILLIETRIKCLPIKVQIEFRNKIKNLFNYEKFQNKVITTFFKENFIHMTCNYCNQTYIKNYEAKSKIISTFQLDHFYENNSYPYLALSFFNYIPSCPICNTVVKNRKINSVKDDFFSKKSIAPNRKDFNFNNQVKFKTFLNTNASIKRINDFELILKENRTNLYEEYIKLLDLNERYKSYKDIALKLIEKRKKYPDSRIKEISILTNQSIEATKKDIFGDKIYADNLVDIPLTKYIKDLSKELGII